MSVENVKKFYEIVAKNEKLQKRISDENRKVISNDMKPTAENKLKVLEAILPIAKEVVGVEITAEDFKEYERQTLGTQLENVSGGVFAICAGQGVGVSPSAEERNRQNWHLEESAPVERGAGVGVCIGLGVGAFYTSGKNSKDKSSTSWCVVTGV